MPCEVRRPKRLPRRPEGHFQPAAVTIGREARGLTVEQLASQLAVHPDRVRDWESGDAKPVPAMIDRLCIALHFLTGFFFRAQLPEGDAPHFLCGEGMDAKPCSRCGFASDVLCDAPMGDGKTCDLALCERCASHVGEDLDLCPLHAAGWKSP